MSTERNPHESTGVEPNEFAGAADGGDLFIRDLPATCTQAPAAQSAADSADDEGYDDEDEGVVTTMMLGEEGDRGGGKEAEDEGIVTTMAVGEEGSRGGEPAS